MIVENYFRPDKAGEIPFTTEVELLLGGIGRAMYPDGTLQFVDQDCTPVAVYSPRLGSPIKPLTEQYESPPE